MSDFPQKRFNGKGYDFQHLVPIQMVVPLNAAGDHSINMQVAFGCHCFTEVFSTAVHQDQHRYTYKGELRAFDVERYDCSLQLPAVLQQMLKGMIYNAGASYTYVTHITIPSAAGVQDYSIFFDLHKDRASAAPALKMFVKSAYLKPLAAGQNAQSWRFVSLAGQLSGAFPPKAKKPKPKKEKDPVGSFLDSHF